MFISEAFAQSADAAGGMFGGGIMGFLPIILIIFVFYFLLIRPQQKRMKEHKAMLAGIRRGDKVVTGGGVIGTVVKVANEAELLVEISDNVRVRLMRDMVASVVSHGGEGSGASGAKATERTRDKGRGKARDAANDAATDDPEETSVEPDEPRPASGAAARLKGLLDKKNT